MLPIFLWAGLLGGGEEEGGLLAGAVKEEGGIRLPQFGVAVGADGGVQASRLDLLQQVGAFFTVYNQPQGVGKLALAVGAGYVLVLGKGVGHGGLVIGNW